MARTFLVLIACSIAVCSVQAFFDDDTYKADIAKTCNNDEEVRRVTSCPPEKTCKDREEYDCAAVYQPSAYKCVCKEGYYRNYLGDCITEEQCDQCKGQNEFYSCGSACDNECSTLSEQNRTNCPIQNIVCNKKCYCEDGFARDQNGKCIPQEQCPTPSLCSGINEEHTDCKKVCPPETCLSLVAKFKCASDIACKAGCACKPGYLREDDTKPCKPICHCPQMRDSPYCLVQNGGSY